MNQSNAYKIAIVILAAGESSRLGRPKQLLNIDGELLLQKTIDTVSASSADAKILVLGAYAADIIPQMDTKDIHTKINPHWQNGLSSSIKFGLRSTLDLAPDIEAILFTLSDQPYLNTALLDLIIQTHITSKTPIVHCRYELSSGPPTLFHKDMFTYLKDIDSSTGAKSVISRFSQKVAYVSFPKGSIDIDTLKDLDNYIEKSNKNL
ncbi:MAG: nucleotidyltransferase family protein [Saprospiraceae bacterium]